MTATTTASAAPDTLIHASECSPLAKTDRCDGCGAQARGRATLVSGGVLLFCGHHLRASMATLVPIALRIEDYTEALHKEEAGGLTAV